ncbi:hypothetical protein FRC09_020654 [Ceratobasidium sp. 395]|nr:hypothetical protein FRC09_020654 [Ceratobasidium sp. 395]
MANTTSDAFHRRLTTTSIELRTEVALPCWRILSRKARANGYENPSVTNFKQLVEGQLDDLYPAQLNNKLMDVDLDIYEEAFRRWKIAQIEFSRALDDFQTASTDFCSTLSASAAYPFPRTSLRCTLSALDRDLLSLQADEERLKKTHVALAGGRNHLGVANPIHSLPPEILATIFSIAGAQYAKINRLSLWGPAHVSPTILSGVCSLWRRVALETHSLWSHIDLTANGQRNRQFDQARLWSERSHNTPLYTTLKDYPNSQSLPQVGVHTNEIENLLEFLAPLMSRVRVLDIWLLAESYEMLSMVVESWIKSALQMPGKVLQLRRGLCGHEADPIILSPRMMCDSISAEAFNTFFRTIKRVRLLSCRIPVPAVFSEALVELHLEDVYKSYGLSQQELTTTLAASPRLRILVLANCYVQPSEETPAPVSLNHLQSLSLECTEDGPSGFEYVFPLLAIGSETLDMSLTLDDDSDFYIEAKSFFSRTRVTRLYVRSFGIGLSLGILFFPMPYLQTLAAEDSVMSGPESPPPSTSNEEAPTQVPWPQLRALYLINPHIDMQMLHFLRNILRLHSLTLIHIHEPLVAETKEPMSKKTRRKLGKHLACMGKELEIYPGEGFACPIDEWEFIIRDF